MKPTNTMLWWVQDLPTSKFKGTAEVELQGESRARVAGTPRDCQRPRATTDENLLYDDGGKDTGTEPTA